MALREQVAAWVARARANGGVTEADLENPLRLAVEAGKPAGCRIVRQHLLYLHATTPSIRSSVIGMALHEAEPGSVTQLTPDGHEWPYATVHDAILDGWQVIHFPDQRAPFDDREIDLLGYEFILQKLEESDE
jgi:hypothetical protein